MMNCTDFGRGCAKGLLLVMNALCMLLAILIFGSAAVDSHILKSYGEEQALGTLSGDIVLIVVSLLLIAVAVLGCVAAALERVKLLYLYTILLMILVLLKVLTGILVGVQRCGIHIRVTDWLRSDFFTNGTEAELEIHNKVWDDLQTTYECCGLNGPDDYTALHQPLSLSCCADAYRARTKSAKNQLYRDCIERVLYYQFGCEEEILWALQSTSDWLLGMATISFLLEAAGIVLAMYLGKSLQNSVKVYKHTVKY